MGNIEKTPNQPIESSEFETQLKQTKTELAQLETETLPEQFEGMPKEQISLAMMINNPSTSDEIRNEALEKYTATMVTEAREGLSSLAATMNVPQEVSTPETYATA